MPNQHFGRLGGCKLRAARLQLLFCASQALQSARGAAFKLAAFLKLPAQSSGAMADFRDGGG